MWASEQEAWAQFESWESVPSTILVVWASDEESQDRFYSETYSSDLYFHPGGCPNCGTGPCYMLCENHPDYYSGEQEYLDGIYDDYLYWGCADEWESWESEHGEDYS